MRFTDGHLVLPLGSKDRMRQDYLEWAAAVRSRVWLPEYKLKRLWKLNYSIADIEEKKHHQVWPPRLTKAERRDRLVAKRGPSISWQRVEAMGLRAMRKEFWRILEVHRLDREIRENIHRSITRMDQRIAELDRRGIRTPGTKTAVFANSAIYRTPLQDWYQDFLSAGKLPGRREVAASLLLRLAQDKEALLKSVTPTALGRFLREQKLHKLHRASGNAWLFDSLGECRARWEAAHGKIDWAYKGEDWLLT